MECSYTGVPISDASEGIWDDGEWVSWDYINSLIAGDDEYYDKPLKECSYDELLDIARGIYGLEDELARGFPIYGEIGELYVESRFGMKRHAPHTEGSDGKIGDHLIEVKTISPLRDSRHVRVKRSGNFTVLAIVKIDANFRIDAKLIKRTKLPKGEGRYIKIEWGDYRSDHAVIV